MVRMEVVVAHLPVSPSIVLVLDIQTMGTLQMQDEMVTTIPTRAVKDVAAIFAPSNYLGKSKVVYRLLHNV